MSILNYNIGHIKLWLPFDLKYNDKQIVEGQSMVKSYPSFFPLSSSERAFRGPFQSDTLNTSGEWCVSPFSTHCTCEEKVKGAPGVQGFHQIQYPWNAQIGQLEIKQAEELDMEKYIFGQCCTALIIQILSWNVSHIKLKVQVHFHYLTRLTGLPKKKRLYITDARFN